MVKKVLRNHHIELASFVIAIINLVFLSVFVLIDMRLIKGHMIWSQWVRFAHICFDLYAIIVPIGTFLGILAIFQKSRTRIYGYIGFIINGCIFLYWIIALLKSRL